MGRREKGREGKGVRLRSEGRGLCGWLVAIPFLALASNLTGEEDRQGRREEETYAYMYTYI